MSPSPTDKEEKVYTGEALKHIKPHILNVWIKRHEPKADVKVLYNKPDDIYTVVGSYMGVFQADRVLQRVIERGYP